jgi:hypothetical protein
MLRQVVIMRQVIMRQVVIMRQQTMIHVVFTHGGGSMKGMLR